MAEASTLQDLAARAAVQFSSRFGRAPRWIAAAPGRVNIIGEHIDYSDGFVLPMAIERYTIVAADYQKGVSRQYPTARFYSSVRNEEADIPLNTNSDVVKGHWTNYIRGVVSEFVAREIELSPFDAVVESNVPVGGGLSSSAALEVATATLLESIANHKLEARDKALLCQAAEHKFAGVPCGIMDQFASVLCQSDHLMLLDCRSQQAEHIPMTDQNVVVLIINTNVKHELSGGEYAERRAQCESAAAKLGVKSLRDVSISQLNARKCELNAIEWQRANHTVSEISRTISAAKAIKAADWSKLGNLMYASHDSLRNDFEVSCRELDLLVQHAKEVGEHGGVFGSRMTGGGFGGCTVTLVESNKVDAVTAQLLRKYWESTGIEGTALISRPARGAHMVQSENGV